MNTSLSFAMNILAGGMLLISFFLLNRMRLITMLRLFSWQSLCLSLYAGCAAVILGEHSLYLSALLTFVIKAMGIPWLLLRVAKQSKASQRLTAYLRPTPSLFAGALLIGLSFVVATKLSQMTGSGVFITSISIAMLLMGLFMLTIRKGMYGQIIGFLMMENGIFTFALALTGGMPLLVELGVFFDVMVGSVLMAALSYRVQREHETVATDQLTELVD